MVAIVELHIDELRALCRRLRVSRLDLFGSAAEGTFDDASSDLDFTVEFMPLDLGEKADHYFGLLQSLEELFGRHVDLIMPGAVKNPYFRDAMERSRTTLYAA